MKKIKEPESNKATSGKSLMHFQCKIYFIQKINSTYQLSQITSSYVNSGEVFNKRL